MTPLVRYKNTATQLNLSPIYDNTDITLVNHNAISTVVIQNHQLITLADAPIMKVVRAIRKQYPNVKINYVS